ARGQASLYSILLPRRRHCGGVPQSLWGRVLDPRAGREARSGGGLGQKETAISGKNRIMIFGPRNDGTVHSRARRQRASMSAYFTNSLTPPAGLGLPASPRGEHLSVG